MYGIYKLGFLSAFLSFTLSEPFSLPREVCLTWLEDRLNLGICLCFLPSCTIDVSKLCQYIIHADNRSLQCSGIRVSQQLICVMLLRLAIQTCARLPRSRSYMVSSH